MFAFEPGLAFWTILAFLIFLFIISKYVVPALQKILEERRQLIDDSLTEAARARAEAEKLVAQSKAEMQKAYIQAEQYVVQARAKQEEFQKKQIQGLQETMETLRQTQAAEVKKIEQNLLAQVQTRIGDYIITACSKVLEEDLPEDLKNKITEKAIDKLQTMDKL